MLADINRHVPDYWQKALWSVLLVLLCSLLIFYDTWVSIVSTWIRTKTYNHGFIVAPISLWLIWSRRSYYQQLIPAASWSALLFVIGFGFLWLVADLSHVLVGKQFAVVGMLVSGFWTVLGNRVASSMLFPLFFLFFMVPVGDQLVAPLMEFTATFTVNMLRLTGLSVYREGTFFTLTSGNWSVVEACSGINYLIASLTLGFVYAYLNYSNYKKRAFFMLLSAGVPIIANGFRAYMIVMIGHFSGMTLAVGVDHIIYGGIFFGLVMLLLFYLGSFWRDPVTVPVLADYDGQQKTVGNGQQRWLVLLVVGCAFLVWPQASVWLSAQQAEGELPDYLSKIQPQGWQPKANPFWTWSPKYDGAVAQQTNFYTDGSRIIGVFHASFGKESQGSELVNAMNLLISPELTKHWRIINHSVLALTGLDAQESVLNNNQSQQDLLVLEWYQIGKRYTTNSYLAKAYQLGKRLKGDDAPELKVVVWTQTIHDSHQEARIALQNFMNDWLAQQNRLLVSP
ncbi:MAG: exosortase A [Methylococcales bacterium]